MESESEPYVRLASLRQLHQVMADMNTARSLADTLQTVANGVVKMNLDTDAQYAFTRPLADHILRNYDGVLMVDGARGDKSAYDRRAWGRLAEAGMAAAVSRACHLLGSAGRSGEHQA